MYPRLLLLFVLLWCNPASASPLIAYTEELPPLNFLQHDKVSGFSSELLQARAAKAAIPLSLQLLPWARGYAMTQSTPGSLLFSTVRTPERENLFRWVGPISPRRIYLYRLTRRKDIQLRNIEQLKQLRTSTLFESATQKRLLELGLRIGEEQDSGRSDAVNLGKLLLGRVDLVAMLDCRFFPLQGVTTVHCEVAREVMATLPGETPVTTRPDTDATLASLLWKLSRLVTSTPVSTGAAPSSVRLASTVSVAVSKPQPSASREWRVASAVTADGK